MEGKVASERHGSVVGEYGLNERNDRGSRLTTFCEENDLDITNTLFQQHQRRLYTWSSPGDINRNHIHYIMINKRYHKAVKKVKTYPGADIASDHVPVVMSIRLQLKVLSKKKTKVSRELKSLKEQETAKRFSNKVTKKYQQLVCEEPLQIEECMETMWNGLKTSIEGTVEEVVG